MQEPNAIGSVFKARDPNSFSNDANCQLPPGLHKNPSSSKKVSLLSPTGLVEFKF